MNFYALHFHWWASVGLLYTILDISTFYLKCHASDVIEGIVNHKSNKETAVSITSITKYKLEDTLYVK